MTRIRAAAAAALLLGLQACGGYHALSEEVEGYRPGGLYLAAVEAPADQETPDAGDEEASPPGPAGDFATETARLEQKRILWRRSIEAAEYEGAFFRPDPRLRNRLAPLAHDDAGTIGALSEGFDLETLRTLVLLRNPGVRAAEERFLGTLERYGQAANLDEILRQYSAFTEGQMTGVGPMKGREPLDMSFPFPGMTALKGRVVSAEARAARETLEIARREALTAAAGAYWNLLFLGKAERITREMLGFLRHLEAVAKTRYEAGKTSFQDVIKVRIQRETVQEDLQTIVERRRNLQARLRELLALPPGTSIGPPLPVEPFRSVPGLERLNPAVLEHRQELRRLRARVSKMEQMIEMAESRVYPDYELGLSEFRAEEIRSTGTAAVTEPFAVRSAAARGAGLPLRPWYGMNDAWIRETRKKLDGLRQELRAAEDRALRELREAWFALDLAVREERLFGESIVDLSQAALEVSTRGYEAGNVMFADVIASYTTWLKANLALERRKADVGVARAALERAVGRSPLPAETGGSP